jgi:hypothetical protein
MYKIGTRSDSVKKLQQMLAQQGFKPKFGDDGIFGKYTRAALKAFEKATGQTAKSLMADSFQRSTGSPSVSVSQSTDVSGGGNTFTATPAANKLTGRPISVNHTDSKGRQGYYIDQTQPFRRNGNSFTFETKGMQVDTDGASTGANGSGSHQNQTALFTKDAKGRTIYADSSKMPYLAIPPAVLKATGAKQGDLVRVTAPNGKQAWAIIADTNDNRPGRKLGEGSLALHRQLGYNSTGAASQIAGNVQYQVFPGSQLVKLGSTSRMPTAAEIQAAGLKLGH